MTDPITGITDKPSDPMARWIAAFKEAYVTNLDEVANKTSDPGILRKTSGDIFKITKITQKMLLEDDKKARQIFAMAERGQLGFVTNRGASPGSERIVFRQDIAEKIGKNRIVVINLNDPDIHELLNEIGSVDDSEYASLAGVVLASESKQAIKENTTKQKKESDTSSTSSKIVGHLLQKKQKFMHMIRDGVRKIALNILKQVRISEKQRIKHAAEVREKEKRIEQQQIKKDIINYEIKHSETNRQQIKATDEIAKQNDGLPKK